MKSVGRRHSCSILMGYVSLRNEDMECLVRGPMVLAKLGMAYRRAPNTAHFNSAKEHPKPNDPIQQGLSGRESPAKVKTLSYDETRFCWIS